MEKLSVVMINDGIIAIADKDTAESVSKRLSEAHKKVERYIKIPLSPMCYFHTQDGELISGDDKEIEDLVLRQMSWVFGGYDKEYIKAILEDRVEEWQESQRRLFDTE